MASRAELFYQLHPPGRCLRFAELLFIALNLALAAVGVLLLTMAALLIAHAQRAGGPPTLGGATTPLATRLPPLVIALLGSGAVGVICCGLFAVVGALRRLPLLLNLYIVFISLAVSATDICMVDVSLCVASGRRISGNCLTLWQAALSYLTPSLLLQGTALPAVFSALRPASLSSALLLLCLSHIGSQTAICTLLVHETVHHLIPYHAVPLRRRRRAPKSPCALSSRWTALPTACCRPQQQRAGTSLCAAG